MCVCVRVCDTRRLFINAPWVSKRRQKNDRSTDANISPTILRDVFEPRRWFRATFETSLDYIPFRAAVSVEFTLPLLLRSAPGS